MEMEIKNIIEKIKEEGVLEAERSAKEIIENAKKEAKGLEEKAKKEKEVIIKNAKDEAEKIKKHGEEALKQAARDIKLGLKEKITELFDNAMKGKIAEELSPGVIKEMILLVAGKISLDKTQALEVVLAENDKKELEKTALSALKEKLSQDVTFAVSPSVEHGFRIGKKGENVYYDFTDEAISEAFGAFLNPRISKILDTQR